MPGETERTPRSGDGTCDPYGTTASAPVKFGR